MMGVIFHNYKKLLQFNKQDVAIDEEYLREDLLPLLKTKPEGKILFYRYSKKWRGFLYSLHKEDRLILLKMILEVSSYSEDIYRMINMQNSESYTDLMFFLLTIMMQQKRIDKLNSSDKKKDITLLDFIS